MTTSISQIEHRDAPLSAAKDPSALAEEGEFWRATGSPQTASWTR